MTEPMATCAWCQSQVPLDRIAEHLSEHTKEGTAELRVQMEVAPVIDETGDNYPALPPSNLTDAELEAQWRDERPGLPLATRLGYYLAYTLVICVIIVVISVTIRVATWIIG